MQKVLKGSGTSQDPYYVCDLGGRRIETTSIKEILRLCDQHGITQLNVAYSGVPWIKQSNGAWKRVAQTCSPGAVELEVSSPEIWL